MVATALIGGLVPAVVAALSSGLLLNVLFTPPVYTLTIAEPANAAAIVIFVLVGIAVATVVDNSARRTAQATRARAEADALMVLSHSLLHAGDDLGGLLASACELFNARGAAILRRDEHDVEEVVAAHGAAPRSVGGGRRRDRDRRRGPPWCSTAPGCRPRTAGCSTPTRRTRR